ncbi:hypothetical protein H0H81_012111, partial [Sphagnurus paluster]
VQVLTVIHLASVTNSVTMGTSAGFSQTLQFITSIKLQELEKQRLSYQEHAKILVEADAAGDDLVKKPSRIPTSTQKFSKAGSKHSKLTSVTISSVSIAPSSSETSLTNGYLVETRLPPLPHSMRLRMLIAESISGPDFVQVGRQEMHDQLDRLTSIIFDEKHIDTAALESYLAELFSGDESSKALETLRKDLERFGSKLKREFISSTDVEDSIRGLLAVLNMRMASLESWWWPAEGLVIEMRRHLNGKYRAFTDPDIIDALLLQYIGIAWQVELKAGFKRILESKAWKHSHPDVSPTQHERNLHQIYGIYLEGSNEHPTTSIEQLRRNDREKHFFLGQLSSLANETSTYDDLLDTPAGTTPGSPAAIKQKLLHIMATECQLNSTIHGSHAVILFDLEWFGPSLPHSSILTILKFFGVPSDWCSFFERFLAAPLRFKQDPEDQPRIRKRGTPISYAISVLCGEAVLFGMDFAVNQRTDGLFLYRMHDDLWLWNANAEKCAVGWKEMNVYADLVGLKFNDLKTGSAYVGKGEPTGLPVGEVRWGFLRFDKDAVSFVIDQKDVDTHIAELPDIIATLARIQRELFPDIEGGAVAYLRSVIKTRFGIGDLPEGYFYLPISSGGLELHHPMIDMFALERQTVSYDKPQGFKALVDGEDQANYKERKERWDNGPSHRGGIPKGPFMDFNEYVALREIWLEDWRECYQSMLKVSKMVALWQTHDVEPFLSRGKKPWVDLGWYEQWIVSLYGEEVVKRFGSLDVVDPTLIPVGMVQLFRTSRMKLDE